MSNRNIACMAVIIAPLVILGAGFIVALLTKPAACPPLPVIEAPRTPAKLPPKSIVKDQDRIPRERPHHLTDSPGEHVGSKEGGG